VTGPHPVFVCTSRLSNGTGCRIETEYGGAAAPVIRDRKPALVRLEHDIAGGGTPGRHASDCSPAEQQNAWIAAQIDAGGYTNDSEAIRDLIRREQERSLEIESIHQALIEGEQSAEPEPFDFAAFKPRKAAQHG
jgi:antitoxin ParD1/3/4